MISQMNLVQNAARLAMDHRAARPLKRRVDTGISRMLALGSVALGVIILAAGFYSMA